MPARSAPPAKAPPGNPPNQTYVSPSHPSSFSMALSLLSAQPLSLKPPRQAAEVRPPPRPLHAVQHLRSRARRRGAEDEQDARTGAHRISGCTGGEPGDEAAAGVGVLREGDGGLGFRSHSSASLQSPLVSDLPQLSHSTSNHSHHPANTPANTPSRQKIAYAKGKSDTIAKLDGTFKIPDVRTTATSSEVQQSIFNAPPSAATTSTTTAPATAPAQARSAEAAKPAQANGQAKAGTAAPPATSAAPAAAAADSAAPHGVKRGREDESDEEEAPMEEEDEDEAMMEESDSE